ncbi:MAG TPA: TetR/AcrR family transcriptional regulator [Anaerolineales bacterium]|nr:TetR/AcrR family transcriptional regulator [Anaerolineales bacterium]
MVRIVKKAEVRRQEIVAAARNLFQAKEYESTTMQDVMDQLGIAKGTIYHYFKSKEELLEAVVESIGEEDLARKQALLDATPGSALVKIRALLRAGSLAEEHAEILESLHSPGNLGMHIRQLAVALMQQAPLYADLIQQGCNEGLFQTEHPRECAEFILSAVQFLTDMGIHPWSQEDLLRRALAFPALIEALLQAPQGSFHFMLEQI